MKKISEFNSSYNSGSVVGADYLTCYSYDNFNRLTHSSSKGSNILYQYNAEDYRIQKSVNGDVIRYLYEADQVILELNDNGEEVGRNVYGTNLIYREVLSENNTEAYYYLYNAHGDVTGLLKQNGTMAATYCYDAFGNLLSKQGQANNTITYAGYQYDVETKLYYLNARYYDSKIARFLTEDTYGGKYNDPLSLNRYTYCTNNPIRYYDPMEHRNLQVGSKGDDVKEMQQLLNQNGYKLEEDGKFGAKTQAAVKNFQSKNNLKVDGIVGNKTIQELKKNPSEDNKKQGNRVFSWYFSKQSYTITEQ